MLLADFSQGPTTQHWLSKVILTATFLLVSSVLADKAFGPFAQLIPLTTDEETENTISAYHRNPAAKIILVGSSLTYRLTQQYFRVPGVKNIAMPGKSALTGMQIVSEQPVLPKVLLVEANILNWSMDEQFTARYRPSILNATALRIRPIRTLLAQFLGWTPAEMEDMYRARLSAVMSAPPAPRTLPSSVYEDWARTNSKEAEDMRRNAADFVALALQLQARGTKVFFVSLPIANEMASSQLAIDTQEDFRQATAMHQELLLDVNFERSELRWTDGAHLDERSAILVIRQIESTLKARKAI